MIRFKDGFNGERAIVLPQIIVNIMNDDPLLSALYITDIGYYPHAEYHFRERTRSIDQYVFIYCVDGAGHYRIGGHEYSVQANQYFILPAGIPHAYWADKATPWTIYWIHFKGTLAPYYARNAVQPMDVKPEAHSRIGQRIDLFEEIFNTLKAGFSNENLHYVSSSFHYYLGSLRFIKQYRNAGSGQVNDDNVADISIHFMKENMEKHLTLQAIAREVGYSPSHFSALFKKKTGHAPLSYFNLLKVQQACFLLDSTDMKVNQICYKIGIEDTYYFSRMFRKIMGMSPKTYRQSKKG